MSYRSSKPSQSHLTNSIHKRGTSEQNRFCASNGMLTEEATTGAHALASTRLTSSKSYASAKASIIVLDSLCHKDQTPNDFSFSFSGLKSRAIVAQLKISSSSLLIPSVWNYCPPQNTHAHTHPYAHTPLNHRDDTLSSNNIP